MNEKLKKELNILIRDYNEITTSDLQGIAFVLAKKYNVSEDELLDYIYDRC